MRETYAAGLNYLAISVFQLEGSFVPLVTVL